MKQDLSWEDLRLKWVDASVLPDGWRIDSTDWALLYCKLGGAEKISTLRLTDINQEYRLKLFKRLEELRAAGQAAEWALHIPHGFRARADDLVQGEFSSQIRVVEGPRLRLSRRGTQLEIERRIRVMNVDDSRTIQLLIAKALSSCPQFDIVAQVLDPLQVMNEVAVHDPDVLTLDIHMPHKNGVEVLREIMQDRPRPSILLTSLSKEDGTLVFEGLAAGAFEYIQKPSQENMEGFAQILSTTLEGAFEAREKIATVRSNSGKFTRPTLSRRSSRALASGEELILIGSSTGGTQALGEILPLLPKDSPPVVIVQHIPPVFSRALAESLDRVSEISVVEAEDGMILESGWAYIAPGGIQLALLRRDGKLRVSLRDDPPVNRFKPSVDYMFHSVARVSGLNISAAVLTGMGRDGAQGLLELKKLGAWTIAQDEKSSVVYGMPRAAKEVGAECEVLSLSKVAEGLLLGLGKRA